jgi:2-oxoglutarate ferredoxin oxidoreductase subunit alpha
VLRRFRRVIVPELNSGHLCRLVRGEYLVDARSISKTQGAPFTGAEIMQSIQQHLEEVGS